MSEMARFLIVLGLVILVAGLLWPYLSQIGLGRLPGDIVIERENVTFYFPLMTCLLLSVLFSLVFWVVSRESSERAISAPRAVLLREIGRERFTVDAVFRPSNIGEGWRSPTLGSRRRRVSRFRVLTAELGKLPVAPGSDDGSVRGCHRVPQAEWQEPDPRGEGKRLRNAVVATKTAQSGFCDDYK